MLCLRNVKFSPTSVNFIAFIFFFLFVLIQMANPVERLMSVQLFVITDSALRKSLNNCLGVTLTVQSVQTSSQQQLCTFVVLSLLLLLLLLQLLFSRTTVQSSAGWISQFFFLKINPGRPPALLQPHLHPDQIYPSVCLPVQPFISPSIHTSILSFLQISGLLKSALACEGRQLSWLQDAGRNPLCPMCKMKSRMWKQLKPLPSPDFLGKTYMPVCFFSESSQREVVDWRPSNAHREGRGRLPPPLPPQQWPSGLHPGHLIALQSSLFKEDSGGRLTVIFSLAHPLPPHLHPKAPAAVPHLH